MSDGHHHPEPESYASLRTKALESLLVEKGWIASDAIDTVVQVYEQDVGPRNGAKVVARAWINPAYKEWLLQDATAAIAALGFVTGQGAELVVVENTPRAHNLIVCTLCSCYPRRSPGAAAQVVQRLRLSLPRRYRTPPGPTGTRVRAGRRRGDPGVGQHRRTALHGAARTARGHRPPERGGVGRISHPGRHDRCGQGRSSGEGLRGCLKSSGHREPTQHQPRHGEGNHRRTVLGQPCIVFAQAT